MYVFVFVFNTKCHVEMLQLSLLVRNEQREFHRRTRAALVADVSRRFVDSRHELALSLHQLRQINALRRAFGSKSLWQRVSARRVSLLGADAAFRAHQEAPPHLQLEKT